eukprot:scaffold427_cov344-Prasinococcus_capsulatus_cf.AAC.1
MEVTIVGGGVVGAAIAAELAGRGREVLLLERNPQLGMETSSRSSEVIHAGLYYPRDSRKAAACVLGRHLLYEFCARAGVRALPLGKLVVAMYAHPDGGHWRLSRPSHARSGHEQAAALAALLQQGAANGVDDLRMLSAEEIARKEPLLRCDAAMFSPSTGIVDTHSLILALQAKAEAQGAQALAAVATGRAHPDTFCARPTRGGLRCQQRGVRRRGERDGR